MADFHYQPEVQNIFMNQQNFPIYKHPSFTGLIGVSREDITPPVGIYSRNWGASPYDVAMGIHRPMTLTCITFQASENDPPLVLISADLGWWKNAEDEKYVRHGILREFGFSSSQLMFCLIHTHAGPSVCRDDAAKPGGELIAPYLDQILNTAIKAIKNALTSAIPATLAWQYGTCNLATNRDLKAKEKFLVGFNHEIVADNTLLVGRITNDQQKTVATIVNYACHPTTLAGDNNLISPDYIGAMREVVEEQADTPCLFLQGASGELAPAEQYVGDPSVADKHGYQLGYAVLSTLKGMLSPACCLTYSHSVESGASLAIWKQKPDQADTTIVAEEIEVPFSLRALPSFHEIKKEWLSCEDRVLKERLWRKLNIRKAIGDGKVVHVPLWMWRLGDSFLIGQPNEPYSDFQLELRQQLSPFAVGVINIANGYLGYLPPKDMYDYEQYAVLQTPFSPGSLESLIKISVESGQKMMNL